MTGDQQTRRRTVRSFVRRAGRLTPSKERALRELWPDVGIPFSEELLDLELSLPVGALQRVRVPVVVLQLGDWRVDVHTRAPEAVEGLNRYTRELNAALLPFVKLATKTVGPSLKVSGISWSG